MSRKRWARTDAILDGKMTDANESVFKEHADRHESRRVKRWFLDLMREGDALGRKRRLAKQLGTGSVSEAIRRDIYAAVGLA